MANVKRGEAEVTLGDGKTYNLIFDFNAMAELERRMGKSIPDLFDFDEESGEARNSPGFDFVLQAITSGLKNKYPKMHATRVGELLEASAIEAYLEAVTTAIGGFFGEKDESKDAGDSKGDPDSGEAPAPTPSATSGTGSSTSETQPPPE